MSHSCWNIFQGEGAVQPPEEKQMGNQPPCSTAAGSAAVPLPPPRSLLVPPPDWTVVSLERAQPKEPKGRESCRQPWRRAGGRLHHPSLHPAKTSTQPPWAAGGCPEQPRGPPPQGTSLS